MQKEAAVTMLSWNSGKGYKTSGVQKASFMKSSHIISCGKSILHSTYCKFH